MASVAAVFFWAMFGLVLYVYLGYPLLLAAVALPFRRKSPTSGTLPSLTVVIPVYNEEKNIPTLFERLNGVISRLNIDAEYIFVNDGSNDNSISLIKNLAAKNSGLKYIDVIEESKKKSAKPARHIGGIISPY